MLFSCDNSNENKKGGSKVRGASMSAPYELLVVCNKDWLGTTNGEYFRDIVNATIPCLPQDEQYFRTTTIDPSNFTKSFMFYANIITADISKKYQKPECRVVRDLYARPQIVISLTAPDNNSFNELCQQNREQILTIFTDAELQLEEEIQSHSLEPSQETVWLRNQDSRRHQFHQEKGQRLLLGFHRNGR